MINEMSLLNFGIFKTKLSTLNFRIRDICYTQLKKVIFVFFNIFLHQFEKKSGFNYG